MSETRTQTERFPIEELWVDSTSVTSVDYDWSSEDARGEWREPNWRAYAVPECYECYEHARWNDSIGAYACVNQECERVGLEIEPDEPAAPMMNYHYPLPDLNRFQASYDAPVDVREVEWRIRDLPLCLVEWDDGGYSLALTGGGMDLSWEICEAFTRLGYLPPLHFADLPAMAGMPRDEDDQYVIDACLRTAEVAELRAVRVREDLTKRYRDGAK